MIKQLIGEMGNFTQVREDENPAMQLGRFVLGGIGWVLVAMAISTYLFLYLVWIVITGSSK
ncbi:MAG: hypothetical protein WBH26_04040 [Pontimonas sp.]